MAALKDAIRSARAKKSSGDIPSPLIFDPTQLCKRLVDEAVKELHASLEAQLLDRFVAFLRTQQVRDLVAPWLDAHKHELRGTAGYTPVIDHGLIAQEAVGLIDHDAIARKVQRLVVVPRIEDIATRAAQKVRPVDTGALTETLKRELIGMLPNDKHLTTDDLEKYGTELAKKLDGMTRRQINEIGRRLTVHGGGSSAAGFTLLAATELPSPSTTVYTFAAATGQPNYIVIDYASKPAIAANGAVNWTWNNSLKQATLNTTNNQCPPPTEDIHGIQ